VTTKFQSVSYVPWTAISILTVLTNYFRLFSVALQVLSTVRRYAWLEVGLSSLDFQSVGFCARAFLGIGPGRYLEVFSRSNHRLIRGILRD
jgi:hypothetical protein